MTTGCATTSVDTPAASRLIAFPHSDVRTVAKELGDASVHLWRIPYALAQGRQPLREVLGAYLGIAPAAVRLDDNGHGKPSLASALGSDLTFNWSHSGNQALIAIARGLELGVDVEHLRRQPRALEIAARYFTEEEARALATLEGEARQRSFIALWCAKEALLKAIGEGLAFGLDRVGCRLDATGNWRLAQADPLLGGTREWQLAGFGVPGDYRGAIAWRGPRRALAAFSAPGAIA